MAKMAIFETIPEIVEFETPDGEKFTVEVQAINALDWSTILQFTEIGQIAKARALAFSGGIGDIEGLDDSEGKPIKNGQKLLLALVKSPPSYGYLVSEIEQKIFEKNTINEETGKNL